MRKAVKSNARARRTSSSIRRDWRYDSSRWSKPSAPDTLSRCGHSLARQRRHAVASSRVASSEFLPVVGRPILIQDAVLLHPPYLALRLAGGKSRLTSGHRSSRAAPWSSVTMNRAAPIFPTQSSIPIEARALELASNRTRALP